MKSEAGEAEPADFANPYEPPRATDFLVGRSSGRVVRWRWLLVIFPRLAALSLFFLLVGGCWGLGQNIDRPITVGELIITFGGIGLATIILLGGFGFLPLSSFSEQASSLNLAEIGPGQM